MRNTFMRQTIAIATRAIKRFSPGSLAMMALALFSEAPVLIARILTVTIVEILVNVATGHSNERIEWAWVATIPTIWSLLALIAPAGSGWWWKQTLGGRSPSERERLAYEDAIELLQSQAPGRLPLPRGWFVLDTPQADAAVSGNTLMLSRGLLESDHLAAVIAHELGHLATPDGRLTAALNRLVMPKAPWVSPEQAEQRAAGHGQDRRSEGTRRYEPSNHDRDDGPRPYEPGQEAIDALTMLAKAALKIAMFATGGTGLRLTRSIWGLYWRGREYKADTYAANLGQADELADFLEVHALMHDHPVPYIWLTEHTHPPSELRIDRLRNAPSEAAQIADRSEPVKETPTGPPKGGT